MESHSVFTDYVRTSDVSGDVPQEVFDRIKSALRNRLRRQGLWGIGPGKLGYDGSKWDGQALQDLVCDCYCHVFIGMSDKNPGQKWVNWKLEVADGQTIERKIYRSFKNFLYDLQQKSLPEDAAVFKNLKKAVKELVADKQLAVVDGDPESFSADWVCGNKESDGVAVSLQSLIQFVGESDDWRPALGSVRKASKGAFQLAKLGIEATSENGHIPFQFLDLKKAVAEKAFSPTENDAHEQVYETTGENDEFSTNVRTILDAGSYALKEQDFDKLEKQMHEKIDALKRRESVKQRLHEIVNFMTDELRGSKFTTEITQAYVVKNLGIAKQTLSDYMKTIRIIADELQNEI